MNMVDNAPTTIRIVNIDGIDLWGEVDLSEVRASQRENIVKRNCHIRKATPKHPRTGERMIAHQCVMLASGVKRIRAQGWAQ